MIAKNDQRNENSREPKDVKNQNKSLKLWEKSPAYGIHEYSERYYGPEEQSRLIWLRYIIHVIEYSQSLNKCRR